MKSLKGLLYSYSVTLDPFDDIISKYSHYCGFLVNISFGDYETAKITKDRKCSFELGSYQLTYGYRMTLITYDCTAFAFHINAAAKKVEARYTILVFCRNNLCHENPKASCSKIAKLIYDLKILCKSRHFTTKD